MDSLLVITEEPALPETLAAELPDVTIAHAGFREAALALQNHHRLIILDDNGQAVPDFKSIKTPVIRLRRPIRLAGLLYTIRERLQGKSVVGREELPLVEGFRFSPSERLIRALNGGGDIPLTEKETELLTCLLEAKGAPVARDMLLKTVWGYSDDIATHTLETHIYRLRGKLRQASGALETLSSDEGGYLLKIQNETKTPGD